MEDILNDLDLQRVSRRQLHPSVLDALALTRIEDALRFVLLIHHHPLGCVGPRPTRMVALLSVRNFDQLQERVPSFFGSRMGIDFAFEMGTMQLEDE